jgi:hypothetical protein
MYADTEQSRRIGHHPYTLTVKPNLVTITRIRITRPLTPPFTHHSYTARPQQHNRTATQPFTTSTRRRLPIAPRHIVDHVYVSDDWCVTSHDSDIRARTSTEPDHTPGFAGVNPSPNPNPKWQAR